MRMVLFIAFIGLVFWFYGDGILTYGSLDHLEARQNAPDVPVQRKLRREKTWQIEGFNLKSNYKFDFTAVVLSSRRYYFDQEAKLSPVDLALGWGPMSNPAPLNLIHISQNNRFYYFKYDNAPPIAKRDIEINSANMHMIPANEAVAETLKQVRRGHIVTIKGYLVNAVSERSGWHWNSSITRGDVGKGACELVYVEEISYQ